MNFYFQAAQVLDRLDTKKGSIKGLVSSVPEKDRKRTQALIIETLKYKPILKRVIEASQLMTQERKKLTSLNLTLLLVHDLLFAEGIQAGDGPIKQAILRHKTRLRGELEKEKIKQGARSHKDLAQSGDYRAALIPRYVRVNTLKTTLDDAVAVFISEGFVLSDPFDLAHGFAVDKHVPNLLLFSPQTTLTGNPLYKHGTIILQDKASCFPAVVLNPPSENAVVIDATAAPGNKTSHLAALMKNQGTLYAFERDRKRFSTLQSMLSKAGCTNVEPINADFLSADPLDPKFAEVTHILLDPSCSGSGIVNRMDYLLETEEESEDEGDRLAKLAAFQLMIIKHAMSFPKVSRIVYSTCSIHPIENEHVVRQALTSNEAKTHFFRLASPSEVLPQWPRRGLPDEMDNLEHASSLVRCMPGEDATNGFFVSCFVRAFPAGTSNKRKSTEEASAAQRKKRKRKKRTKAEIHAT